MERNQLKSQYRTLYSDIEAILFKHDLMGINFEDNTDEYAPEVDTILPRLKDARNKEDVITILHEEFMRWFGEGIVKNKNHPTYLAMATEIWAAWVKHSGTQT